MKRIKNYSLAIAILLIMIGSMAFLYWYGFHKKFDKKSIPPNADGIVIVDIKNIRNHFVFSYLKNPSQWESNSNNSRMKKQFDISTFGIETPDYLTFFHIKNQPLNQWCCIAKIENKIKFNKSLIDSHFVKTNSGKTFTGYYSKTIDAYIIQYANEILYCTNASYNQQACNLIAENSFLKHIYFDSKKIEKVIGSSNAITVWVKKNRLLEEDGILNLKLEDQEIIVDGELKLKHKKEWQFTENPNALLSFGFDFKMIREQNFLKSNTDKINKIMGFDLDSILSYNPTKTELVLNKIIEKKDSAISYEYDDDFNPIKKVIVHNSREPSFSFSIQVANTQKVYDYLKKQNAIDNHNVFVNFPLAQTKALVKDNSLKLEANSLKNPLQRSFSKIGYLQVHLDQLQPKDWRFIIAKNKNLDFLKSFEIVEIDLSKKNSLVHFRANLKTKDEKSLTAVLK